MVRAVTDVVVVAGMPVATVVVGGARHVDDVDVAEAVFIDGVAAVIVAVAVVVAVSGHKSACRAKSREA